MLLINFPNVQSLLNCCIIHTSINTFLLKEGALWLHKSSWNTNTKLLSGAYEPIRLGMRSAIRNIIYNGLCSVTTGFHLPLPSYDITTVLNVTTRRWNIDKDLLAWIMDVLLLSCKKKICNLRDRNLITCLSYLLRCTVKDNIFFSPALANMDS